MFRIILAAVALVGICIVGMCFNIIFRKGGQFPETEISRNKEMRKRGIRCAKDEELRMLRKMYHSDHNCDDNDCSGCSGCGH